MAGPLAGKRILIVEDEYFIASDLTNAMTDEDASIIGPTGDIAEATRLIAEEAPDAVILDVNLNQNSAYPLATDLQKRDIPYIFLTGYDASYLPPEFSSVPVVAKPFAMQAVIDAVGRIIGPPPL